MKEQITVTKTSKEKRFNALLDTSRYEVVAWEEVVDHNTKEKDTEAPAFLEKCLRHLLAKLGATGRYLAHHWRRIDWGQVLRSTWQVLLFILTLLKDMVVFAFALLMGFVEFLLMILLGALAFLGSFSGGGSSRPRTKSYDIPSEEEWWRHRDKPVVAKRSSRTIRVTIVEIEEFLD